MGEWVLVEADVVDALRAMGDCTLDGAMFDPPYGLGTREPTVAELIAYLTGAELDSGGDFMGKQWRIPSVAFWRELCRVLKPGAYVISFAGTRTLDLIMLGMRAGGLEMRDSIGCAMPGDGAALAAWMYAQGWSKCGTIGSKIDEAAGATREVIGEKRTPDGKRYSARVPNSAGQYNEECAHNALSGRTKRSTEMTAPATPEGALWDGHGVALAPAWEPLIIARKPLEGTIVENVLKHGTGGMDIDASRVGSDYEGPRDGEVSADRRYAKNGVGFHALPGPRGGGRWPKNAVVVHDPRCVKVGTKRVAAAGGDVSGKEPSESTKNAYGKLGRVPFTAFADADGTEEVAAYDCVPSSCPAAILDKQSGNRPGMSGGGKHREGYGGGMFGGIDSTSTARGDDGAASRFYANFQYTEADRFRFVAKASRAEREFGCEELPIRRGAPTEDGEEPEEGSRNIGPCIKPLTLVRYFAGLIKPPKRADGKPLRLVVPYSGTGSEMIGALRAGWDDVIGIQRAADDDERAYLEIARARLARWQDVPKELAEGDAVRSAKASRKGVGPGQATLFGSKP